LDGSAALGHKSFYP